MNFDILSEENERQNIHYYCISAGNHRYDLTIIYSVKFLGKAMVVSLQSERMALLCDDDIPNTSYWAPKLGVHPEDTKEVGRFLTYLLGQELHADQY
ncbi:SAV0927 family protein [Ectobacillus sp. sgz5001026]|uniref:SAV0927 family protein n=1 Tax=Ectobacillus sp. sgz5001026 TaxID=3242473 RepID=UPI0036D3D72F